MSIGFIKSLIKIPKKNRQYFYRENLLIKKIVYYYPYGDNSNKLELHECVWNKGKKDERKGWPACSLQLVCPFTKSYVKTDKIGIVRCDMECRNLETKKAIEAFITLHPDIH